MEFRDQPFEVKYIGDVSGPWGLEKLQVDGVALVTELDGTGSDPRPSSQREYLISEIKTHNIDDIGDLLADEDNTMVSIKGHIPAAARKGDRFDVEVKCFEAKTTSLKGGYLMQARMKPMLTTRKSVQLGHNAALARGRVLVNSLFESTSDKNNDLTGWVLGGGIVTKERQAGLRLLEEHKSVQAATAIARAINGRFSTRNKNGPVGVATPKSDREIFIEVPDDYRLNVGRYFHVLLNIAFSESADDRVNRLEWLERELHEPSRSSLAAIRLEAIGDAAIPALKRGLRSEDIQVRFHAAQALAYLEDSSGIEQLTQAIIDEPAFRWHGLTALAALHNSASERALTELLNADSIETRYGAFRALRESRPGTTLVAGELMGGEFMYHELESKAQPMVHFSKTKVPEIALFGKHQRFRENLLFFESGLTVKSIDENRVQIQLYLPHQGEKSQICSTQVSDVIRCLANLGYDYGDMLNLLKDAKRTKALDSQLVINAVPQLNNSYRSNALSTGFRESSDRFIPEPMPEMFDDSGEKSGSVSTSSDSPSPDGDARGKGFFDRIQSFWSP